MGRIRFKLPHAWFFKLNTTGESIACTSSSPLVGKHILSTFLSPADHDVAIDIPFSAESPKKGQLSVDGSSAGTSSHYDFTHTFQEDIAILSTQAITDNWPSINSLSLRNTSNQPESKAMDYCSEEDEESFHGFSSPKRKSGSVNNGAAFDVNELERKLKALESEDRTKYYTSPMFTGSLPTPAFETNEITGEEGSPSYYRQDMYVRKSSMRVLANASPIVDRGFVNDDSSNESNSLRQSTSSSDAAIERRSSSQWETDAFSTNSEWSKTLTTGEDRLDLLNHIKRQRSPAPLQGKPKDWVSSVQRSPLLYPISYAGSPTNAHRAEFTHGPYQDNEYGDPVYADNGRNRNHQGIARKESPVLSTSNTQVYVDSSLHVGKMADEENMECGRFDNRNYRSSPKASPVSSRGLSRRGQHAVELMKKYYPVGLHPASPVHEQNSYQLPLVETKSKRVYAGGGDQFSYMGCKERLLSGRTSFEQGNGIAGSEGEVERLSNYDKFKLRQMSNTHGKLNRAWSLSPELGPYKPLLPNRNLSSNASLTRHESYHNTPEHHHARGPSQRSQGFDHIKLSPHGKGSNGGLRNNTPHAHAERGPSWSNKGTLEAVREKTRDTSFYGFSTIGRPDHSRVFDSVAMVKCSYDPKQDFKQSMVEMIFEKDLNSSHDMVELLQCYLTLNPPSYHDTIVKGFTEVWSEVFQDV